MGILASSENLLRLQMGWHEHALSNFHEYETSMMMTTTIVIIIIVIIDIKIGVRWIVSFGFSITPPSFDEYKASIIIIIIIIVIILLLLL